MSWLHLTTILNARSTWGHICTAVFEPIRNEQALFRAMKIQGGMIAWPHGADIDPNFLYCGLTPARMEESERVRS